MSEVGLGIGRYRGVIASISQEILYWYDENHNRYLTAEEQAEQERHRVEQLEQYLRSRSASCTQLIAGHRPE
jgi:hypothetical protein